MSGLRRVYSWARRCVSLYLRRPARLRYIPRWLGSFFRPFDPLSLREPWLTYEAADWLEGHVDRSTGVFEYGSGGSTLFFMERAGRVVSVEHDPAWHGRVVEAARDIEAGCCSELLLREPETAQAGSVWAYGAEHFTTKRFGHEADRFESYVKAIDGYAEFDLVFVDGRCRPACVKRGLGRVKPGGVVVLDNSERNRYAEVSELMSGHERMDFEGLMPRSMRLGRTTVWRVGALEKNG